MNRLATALGGLVAGTMLGFALLALGYVVYAELTDDNSSFGMAFGMVIAPALGLLIGIAMAAWLHFGRVRRPGRVILGAIGGAIASYLLAVSI